MHSNMLAIKNTSIVLEDAVINDGILIIQNGKIVQFGHVDLPSDVPVIDAQGQYTCPGFVDIHCHAGGAYSGYTSPAETARYHLKHGTTSLLITIYHNVSRDEVVSCADQIRQSMAMGEPGNLRGMHFEGPFLSSSFGAYKKLARPYTDEEYCFITSVCGDLIRQWTFSPDIENAAEFASRALKDGYTLSMGHTAASCEQVLHWQQRGVNIITHLGDATGCSIPQSRYSGTKEVDFDTAALLSNAICEVIPDGQGIHVRPDMLKFYLKVKGADKLALITDAMPCKEYQNGVDVNIENGSLCGSWLTMDCACRNMQRHTGAGITEICRMASSTPARAIGLFDITGSIVQGKNADLVILDAAFNIKCVLCAGRIVSNDA